MAPVRIGSNATESDAPAVALSGLIFPTEPNGLLFAALNGMVAVPPDPFATRTKVPSGEMATWLTVVAGNVAAICASPDAASTPVEEFILMAKTAEVSGPALDQPGICGIDLHGCGGILRNGLITVAQG